MLSRPVAGRIIGRIKWSIDPRSCENDKSFVEQQMKRAIQLGNNTGEWLPGESSGLRKLDPFDPFSKKRQLVKKLLGSDGNGDARAVFLGDNTIAGLSKFNSEMTEWPAEVYRVKQTLVNIPFKAKEDHKTNLAKSFSQVTDSS